MSNPRSRPRRLVGQTSIALLLVVVGVNFLAAPDRATSGSYAVAYDVADALPGSWSAQAKWGFAFLVAGLLALIVPRVIGGWPGYIAAAIPIFWLLWWAGLLFIAIVKDQAQSLNGPWVWGTIAVIYWWSLATFGPPRRMFPRP